jgi:hypothetical protein
MNSPALDSSMELRKMQKHSGRINHETFFTNRSSGSDYVYRLGIPDPIIVCGVIQNCREHPDDN